MHVIPVKTRQWLANDPFMRQCIQAGPDCSIRIEFEHALMYAGKQLQEAWAIVPCCTHHHRGTGLIKDYNRFTALMCAPESDLVKYPKAGFIQERQYLLEKYGATNPDILVRCAKRKATLTQRIAVSGISKIP